MDDDVPTVEVTNTSLDHVFGTFEVKYLIEEVKVLNKDSVIHFPSQIDILLEKNNSNLTMINNETLNNASVIQGGNYSDKLFNNNTRGSSFMLEENDKIYSSFGFCNSKTYF